MTTVAFPVLARTAGTDELFVLRRRMVRLLAMTVFPLLLGLVRARAGRHPLGLRPRLGAGRRSRPSCSPAPVRPPW